jgi:C1A family cysteine protease
MRNFPLRQCLIIGLAFVLVGGLGFPLGESAADDRNELRVPIPAPLRPEVEQPLPPGRGFIPPRMDLSHLKGDKIPDKWGAMDLPDRWDWRENCGATSVRDQGDCGSCYAFAAVGNFESRLLIDMGQKFDFSENNVKECIFGDPSCGGGNYYKVASFLSQQGLMPESCDEYEPSDVLCDNDCSDPYMFTVYAWIIISADVVPSTEVLKSYIYNEGPVYAAMYSGHNNNAWQNEFNNYDGSYTLRYTGTEATNHAVLIVGWDDNLSHSGGQGAWIVKNSWGTDWGGPCGYDGENGYFTIAYGSAGIGKWSSALYNWKPYNHYGGITYHDEEGWNYNWGYGTTTAWGMCKFVQGSDIEITRIEYWTNDAPTTLDIYIYDSFDGANLSDPLRIIENKTHAEAGYHGAPLSSPLPITAGNDIYVAIKYTNTDYTFPITVDSLGWSFANTTYTSDDGTGWYDISANDAMDVAIRVRYNTGECVDSDGDSYGDPDQGESDCIGIDNCPYVYNIDQTDTDGDGIGDACECVCGDANNDNMVNIGDAVYLIRYIFRKGCPPTPLREGDANCSFDVDVGDAVYLVNHVFKDGPPPCPDQGGECCPW